MALGRRGAETGRRWTRRLCRAALVAACWVAGPAAAADYGPIRPGESLWQVSARVHPGMGLDRNQVLLALWRANPQAITPPCNVNGTLRVGARLKVPAAEEIATVSPAAAREALAQQARDWSEGRRKGRPLDCTPVAEGAPAAEVPPVMPAPVLTPTPAPAPAPDQSPPVPAAVAGCAAGAPAVAVSSPAPEPVTAQCQCPPEATTKCAASTRGLHLPAPGGSEPATVILPEGPSAPLWVLILLALGLAVMGVPLRREAGAPLLALGSIPRALAAIHQGAALRFALGPGQLHMQLLLAAVVGVLGAGTTVLFREGLSVLTALYSDGGESLSRIAVALAWWERLLVPAAGGLIAGLILQEIGGRLRGPKSADYMEAVRVGDGWVSVRQSLVRSTSSLFSVASGGSIGREGAIVQLAAMVASAVGRVLRLPPDRLRLLVAAGAAAGLAAAYKAPLAATIFVAEIVIGSIVLDSVGPLIVAAVVASVTVHDVMGYAPIFELPELHLLNDWEMVLCLVLGLIAGHLAPLFLRLLQTGTRWFGSLPFPLALRMGLGGLIVGAISVYEPLVWGNGHTSGNSVLLAPWAWQALVTLLLLKLLATASTIGSGAVGGAFTPALFAGALLGLLFGGLVHSVMPAGVSPANVYAVVGMGAVLAGITHAPLMAILMILEMTMDYEIVLPLMLAVVVAHYTAARYTWVRPMYAESLLPRAAAGEPSNGPAT